MKLKFTLNGANGDSQSHELGDGLHVVGREPKCALVLDGDGCEHVSWNHASFKINDDGAFLKDLESSNGTFLNDRKLAVETKVLDGDEIQFGRKGPRLIVDSVELDELVSQSVTSGPSDPPTDVSDAKPVDSPVLRKTTGPPPLKPVAPRTRANRTGDTADEETSQPSSTRALLIRMQKSQRGWRGLGIAAMVALLVVVVVSLILFGSKLWEVGEKADVAGEEAEKAKRRGQSGPKATDVYNRTLKSTAWIIAKGERAGTIGTGTGSLIDKQRRLVVTNYHVVGNNRRVVVLFPDFRNGDAISERSHYRKKARAAIRRGNGTVLVNDRSHDVAIIQLDSVPDDVPPLELVDKSPRPGTRVHTVGNPAAGGALWTYSIGAVRQVAKVTFKTKVGSRINTFNGWAVETQNPINSGDSGGPVVNDDGRLVAINMSHRTDARLVTHCVDIREIHQALRSAIAKARP